MLEHGPKLVERIVFRTCGCVCRASLGLDIVPLGFFSLFRKEPFHGCGRKDAGQNKKGSASRVTCRSQIMDILLKVYFSRYLPVLESLDPYCFVFLMLWL